MKPFQSSNAGIRLHLTNVAGAGAVQLLQSLLPALENCTDVTITDIFLPDRGPLAAYRSGGPTTRTTNYPRRLPNALSRLLECTLLGGQFDGSSPVLVFGDLPLRCRAPQTVFVQTSHLLRPRRREWTLGQLKFSISRAIFRRNLKFASNVIVQTELMRSGLIATYPALADKVYVLAQPVPGWMQGFAPKRHTRNHPADSKLHLIYPAASYPHKNHGLLSAIDAETADRWPVMHLDMTIAASEHPAPSIPWLRCLGFLKPAAMVEAYQQVDGLVFLSREESYGFPLVEAMYAGLPIVCPDLPYAHALCGDSAIYFNPDSLPSLEQAINELDRRLRGEWWPDWRDRLAAIPGRWSDVARRMLDIALVRPSLPEQGLNLSTSASK